MSARRFKRGWSNLLYTDPWLREKLGASVKKALRVRALEGWAIGRPRRGEVRVGEPRMRGTHARRSPRRYVGLDELGAQVLKMATEGARLVEIQRMTAKKGDAWPISTIWQFLQRRKKEGRLA